MERETVENFNACWLQLKLYIPYDPYRLYRAPVRVQYTYTTTKSMGCTELSEPQYL